VRLRARSEHPLLAGTVAEASKKRWKHPYAAADARDGGEEELMAGEAVVGRSGGEESGRAARPYPIPRRRENRNSFTR